MATTTWTLSDEQTLAEYVPLDTFRGVLERRIHIPPDYLALLIRDGRLVDAYQGAHFAVGGLWNRVKEWIGGEHALRLLVADLKPFPVQAAVKALTADHVPVGATVSFELQVNPERGANVLGLMGKHRSLSRQDLYDRVAPHLQDRVFEATMRQVPATELRGNTALQDRIQAQCMQEVERLAGDLGMLVRAVSVEWALNPEEVAAIERRDRQREEQRLDLELQRRKREVEREKESTVLTIQTDVEIAQVQVASDADLQRMFLEHQIELTDARDSADRVSQAKQLQHELELLKTRRLAAYGQAIGDAQNALERTRLDQERRRMEVEFHSFEIRQRLELERLEKEQELEIASRAREQQLKTLREMQALDLSGEREHRQMSREDLLTQHTVDMDRDKLRSDTELEKLRIQGAMNPDQILAINAGLSPDVARVFAERARTDATAAAEKERLLREMVQLSKEGRMASEDQAKFFFDRAMDTMAGKGPAGGQPPAGSDASQPTSGETTECPDCHHRIPVSDRHCRYCGRPMRT